MSENKKPPLHKILRTIFLLLAVSFCLQLHTAEVKAATKYTRLELELPGSPVKSGPYYFKWVSSSYQVMISTKKNSGYQKTPIPYVPFCSNGKQAYYFQDNILCKYVFSTRKEIKVKTLAPLPYNQVMSISAVYGSQIFATKSSYSPSKVWTYIYHIQKKTWKKVLDNGYINHYSGSYATVRHGGQHYDFCPYPVTLYKITSSGLSKIKKLGTYIYNEKWIGNQLYYASYPNASMQKATLYRFNPDGSKHQKIKTFQTSRTQTRVIVVPTNTRYCEVQIGDRFYRFTYSTKKLTRISK